MDTRYLRTLLAVIDCGSFSLAADKLHLTQSAVSQRIKFLEEAYGASLFDRSGTKPTLTVTGTTVLESARRILDIEASLLGKLKGNPERQRLALCCTPTFGTVYLPKVLNLFMAEARNQADLNFLFYSPHQALDGVLKKEFDIAVVEHTHNTDLSRFHHYTLPDDELVFTSSPRLGLPTPKITLDMLLDKCLYARKEGCSSRQLITQGLQQQGISLDDFSGVVISDDLRLTCQTVLAGQGVSFLSRSLVNEFLESGELVCHYVEGFPHRRRRSVVMEKGRIDDPLLLNFSRYIFQVMETPAPF
ncbi:MAG TPA: LysR family transcriptional regulator [Pelovirga sp.]|nr:LysR family transcriptional regulator [Pelovirga sp.]